MFAGFRVCARANYRVRLYMAAKEAKGFLTRRLKISSLSSLSSLKGIQVVVFMWFRGFRFWQIILPEKGVILPILPGFYEQKQNQVKNTNRDTRYRKGVRA